MTISGRLLKIIAPDKNYSENNFYAGENLIAEIAALPKKNLAPLGEKFFLQEAAREKFKLDDRDSFLISIHKFFFNYLKEEGIGMMSTKEFRKGFCRVVENLPLPDLFVIGVLRGILQYFHMRGYRIKEERSKEEGERTSEYLVTWMTSNV